MLYAPGFLLSLSASLVLFALGQSTASAAQPDLSFDGVVINSAEDNRPGISLAGSNLGVLINDSTVTTDGQFSHGVVLSGAGTDLLVRGSSFTTLGNLSHGLSFAGANNTGS